MARRITGPRGPTPIESIRHKDTRVNIPTEELRRFVAADEDRPKALLYPRDPTLDPQLVWKGKDAQDARPLEVPIVPIYIQEKIVPEALVENLRDTAKPGEQEPELLLFDDFNGIDAFDKKVDFYRHDQHWANRMILGDSLTVVTSLAEKEGLKGKVQTIYFDPPYGIRFGSNWQVSTRKRDVKDGKVEDATRQPEQIRAFRDTWELGVHSYLSYLRDRLTVGRDLLTETGSIFVQIGDENVHLVRCVMDEVFGSENFCSEIVLAKASAQSSELVAGVCDFLLWYAKSANQVKYRELFSDKDPFENPTERYVCVETSEGKVIDLSVLQKSGQASLPEGRVCRLWPTFSQTGGKSSTFDYTFGGHVYSAPGHYGWQTTRFGLDRLNWAGRLFAVGKSLRWKVYHDEFPYKITNNAWLDLRPGGFGEQRVYVVQTSPGVIARCLLMTTDPGDLVLDPTCGSGTTAYVAEQWGRRWITIDTSRVALALARTRLMAAKFPSYLLADSPEGMRREAEITGKLPAALMNRGTTGSSQPPALSPSGAPEPEGRRRPAPGLRPLQGDIRKGFVYKRVPHVTLKSIANNPDIKEGMTREEIDAAIARHADTEFLFDKPYEDPKRIRVTGPFSVESLSPHRVLVADDGLLDSGQQERAARTVTPRTEQSDFAVIIIDNLRRAGVQNTKKNERLVFDRLDPHAGTWIQATGEYTDAEGKIRRVAVSIGPEHGTVGPNQVWEAAKEAVQGFGHDVLIVCGFAFDPHVTEEAKNLGPLAVLITRMNPDLAMGDDLLKKTGAANLFMVFGEPDIDLEPAGTEGHLLVRLNGVDIYDPTTGEVRSDSTDDIACWFIDTDYDGESFFVRHAYFTGAGEPYEKLKRALRAEIDEAAWSTLYSTVSRPFAPPESGKIAVKVINHYGDEVLKVFSL